MKKLVVFLISLFISLDVYAQTFSQTVTFNRCVDGDTAVFNVDGDEVKFRFLAIDTPETVHPTKDVEAYGTDASSYTCEKLINAKEIIVEYEKTNKVDKYGRSLAWIWVDGSLLQKDLISKGLAKVAYIYGTYRYTESLCVYQNNAIKENVGIWTDDEEVGYCETISLESITDNIKYENINDTLENDDESNEKIEQATDVLNEIESKLGNFNDLLSQKGNIYFYAIIGSAIIYIIYKEIKR